MFAYVDCARNSHAMCSGHVHTLPSQSFLGDSYYLLVPQRRSQQTVSTGSTKEKHGTTVKQLTLCWTARGTRDMGSREELTHSNSFYVPKMMVTNVMSIVPKMSEVCEFVLCNNVSLAFITETWFQSSIAFSVIDIPGYSVLRRDRSSDHHGGVCLYINAVIRYKRLDDLSCCSDHEVL